jgi:hypothetical protein
VLRLFGRISARAHVHVRARACVRVFVCVCARARVRVCVCCECSHESLCLRACVRACVRARESARARAKVMKGGRVRWAEVEMSCAADVVQQMYDSTLRMRALGIA